MNREHLQLIKKMNQDKFEKNSKKRLMANITKKFKTTMIGALAQFEKEFGYLWGMKNTDLTEEQKKFFIKWQAVRTEILNNGNSQLRACLEEISQYTMKWDRYHTDFIIKRDTGGIDNE